MFNFPYRKSWYITHPLDWLKEFFRQLEWAKQRLARGWDDRALWSIDIYLIDMLVPILKRFKHSDGYYPGELNSEIVDEIIAGFEAAKRIIDWDYENGGYEEDNKIYERGMQLFTKYFFCLWD